MRLKPVRLRATGMRTPSGKAMLSNSERSGHASQSPDVQVGIPGMRVLRKPVRKPEPPREMSELERVRERMAKKMQERLRQMEEQDVADSWEEPENQLSAGLLGGEQPGLHDEPGLLEALSLNKYKTPTGPAQLEREKSLLYV